MAQSAPTSSASPFAIFHIQTPQPLPHAASSSGTLSERQTLLTASVLDLFAGYPTKRKLSLWRDDATFADPLTIATGRKQFEAQWYGLKAVMSKIEPLQCEVVSAGNPIELALTTKYTVKGVGSEQTVQSRVMIHTSGGGSGGGDADEKIVKVEDKWNGKLPEGAFSKAMRNLNSVTVPVAVSVPKSIEEEEAQWQSK